MNNINHYYYDNTGIGLGNILAAVISWNLNHDILWGILHTVFGWFYVIYWALCL